MSVLRATTLKNIHYSVVSPDIVGSLVWWIDLEVKKILRKNQMCAGKLQLLLFAVVYVWPAPSTAIRAEGSDVLPSMYCRHNDLVLFPEPDLTWVTTHFHGGSQQTAVCSACDLGLL